MKHLPFILFVAMILSCFACNQAKDTPTADVRTPPFLLNCWIHVHEETVAEGRYFQPCDYDDLPASRYRATYNFQENNVCIYSVLSPIDAHYSLTGKWEYNEENAMLKIYDANEELVVELEVLELAENRLIVIP